MPAWTYNLLVVSGPQAEVDAFEAAAKEPSRGLDFSFRSLLPPPASAEMTEAELREWTLAHYGNKLGSGAAVLCSKRPCLLLYYFLSPWNQSNFSAISARFPGLELGVWFYREDGPEAVGVELSHAGGLIFSAEDDDCSGYGAHWRPFYAAALEELYIRHLAGCVVWTDKQAAPPDSGRVYRLDPPQRGDDPEEGYRTFYREELKQLLLGAARRQQSYIAPVEELSDIWKNLFSYGLDDDREFCRELAEALAITRIARLDACLQWMDRLQRSARALADCSLSFSLNSPRGFGFFLRPELRHWLREDLRERVEALELQVLQRTQPQRALGLAAALQPHIEAGTVAAFVRRSLDVYRCLQEQLHDAESSVSIGALSWTPVGVWDHEALAGALNAVRYPLEDAVVALLGTTEHGQYSDGWPL
jgi:hypothetical protein